MRSVCYVSTMRLGVAKRIGRTVLGVLVFVITFWLVGRLHQEVMGDRSGSWWYPLWEIVWCLPFFLAIAVPVLVFPAPKSNLPTEENWDRWHS